MLKLGADIENVVTVSMDNVDMIDGTSSKIWAQIACFIFFPNPNYNIKNAMLFYLPFEIVNAGDHWDLSMSKQIEPLLLMLGWYMRVVKATFGGLNG